MLPQSVDRMLLDYRRNKARCAHLEIRIRELEELRQICDRIAIVSGGRIAGILPAARSSEEFGMLMVSQVK